MKKTERKTDEEFQTQSRAKGSRIRQNFIHKAEAERGFCFLIVKVKLFFCAVSLDFLK